MCILVMHVITWGIPLPIGANWGWTCVFDGAKALLPPGFVECVKVLAKESGARTTVSEDIDKAVRGADFVHTDVWAGWASLLELLGERARLLLPLSSNTRTNEHGYPKRNLCTAYPHSIIAKPKLVAKLLKIS